MAPVHGTTCAVGPVVCGLVTDPPVDGVAVTDLPVDGVAVDGWLVERLTSSAWGWLTVLSPMTPWRRPASAVGTSGAAALNRATRPDGSLALPSATPKACSTVAVVPDTGMRSPFAVVDPTVSPLEASHARVAVMVAGRRPEHRGELTGGQVVVERRGAGSGDGRHEGVERRRVTRLQGHVQGDGGGGRRRTHHEAARREGRRGRPQRHVGGGSRRGEGGAGTRRGPEDREHRQDRHRHRCQPGHPPRRSAVHGRQSGPTGTVGWRDTVPSAGRCFTRWSRPPRGPGVVGSTARADHPSPAPVGVSSGASGRSGPSRRHFRSRSPTTASWPRSLGS